MVIFRKNVMITKFANEVLDENIAKYKNIYTNNKINKYMLIDYAVLKVFNNQKFNLLIKEKSYNKIHENYENIKQ